MPAWQAAAAFRMAIASAGARAFAEPHAEIEQRLLAEGGEQAAMAGSLERCATTQ